MKEAYIKQPILAGTNIFCVAPGDEEAVAAAKAFIAENALTAEDVKIVKRATTISVILKKDWNGKN